MKRITSWTAILAVLIAAPLAALNPLSPTNLAQFQSDGTTPIAQGGNVTGGSVVLRATVNTTDAQAQLRIEVKLVAQAFTGVATQTSPLTNNGLNATLTFAGLAPGSYKWQAWIFCT